MLDNVEPRYISKQNHVRTVFTPELPDIPKVFQNDFLEGFIKHPKRFPIEVRRLRFWERLQKEYTNTTDIGFNFFSKEYQSGALSFEIISNGKKLISNCGYYDGKNEKLINLSKSTAAQSTLVFDDNSSCKFKKFNGN